MQQDSRGNAGKIIVLNGPSGSGKSTIQREFQKLMIPDLWVKVGIDNLFDSVMPDITPENMHFWQSPNSLRWVEATKDEMGNPVITLFTGVQGERVAYAMNSSIAAYAKNRCDVIVDYIAYKREWLTDLNEKLSDFEVHYVRIDISIALLEQREELRGTSPKGHARSHYFSVHDGIEYDLVINTGETTAQDAAHVLQQFIATQG